MAHKVTFTLPERDLGNADIELRIKRDGGMFGTVKISKGALVWVPATGKFGRKISWTKLAEFAEENGSPE